MDNDKEYPYTNNWEPPTHAPIPQENDKIIQFVEEEFKKVKANEFFEEPIYRTTLDF